jgi:xanthine dehydrogenase YagR molybdenum-binding subunit
MASGTPLIGAQVDRVDGRRKVTGTAQYASEAALPHMTHAVLVGSTVPSGRVVRIDAAEAERSPGVVLILTHENRGRLGRMPVTDGMEGWTPESRPPLDDDRIHYFGQYVAMVVAETLEQARHAASLVRVEYERTPFAVALPDAREPAFRPKQFLGDELQAQRGDTDGALTSAEIRLDVTYTSPNQHPCAMEMHGTVATWEADALTVYNATQWVMGDHAVLAAAFELPGDKVRVLAPFVGGMFGSKAMTPAHTVLAALASRRLARPVKAVLSRQQVLTNVGHRAETEQRFELGATRDGTLVAMRHHTLSHAAENEGSDQNEYHEATNLTSRMLYACRNYEGIHESVRLNVMKPAWMRAPGEASGLWALESAMDELAYTLDIDPVELRRRNHADVQPQIGKAFSSKHLLACYERGAQRFGWGRRKSVPGSMREGGALVGWGMATATYPGYMFGATARVRLMRDGSAVRAVVSTAGSDVGTGLYTVMALVAAEGLGLPLDRVTAELGDSHLTPCAVAGGSNLTASTAPAIMDACSHIRRQLLALASGHSSDFEGASARADDFVFADGRIAQRSRPSTSIAYAELLARGGRDALEAEAKTEPKVVHDDRYAYQSFGAQFVEVRVHPEIGRIRISRVVSVFDVGRVVNAKATRSQLIGGIVFGIGQALLEELAYDRVHGQPVNADLAGYLVPVHADVPDIDVSWIDEPDLNFNSVGCRGVGEIGITGVAAAIGNAVYHATGKRIRELPITPEKLL